MTADRAATAEDREELRRLAAAATGGRWRPIDGEDVWGDDGWIADVGQDEDAALIAAMRNALPALLDAADRADAEAARADAAEAKVADERAARQIAGESADRFRDVLSECLGHPDCNPGDDALVQEVRQHFGKTGPEPHRWRDFCSGALARLDQIHAARAEGETPR